jgi:hypothetical protein
MAQRLATLEEVLTLYPGAQALPFPLLQTYLDMAGFSTNVALLGEKASQAHALLAAHLMAASSAPAGAAGAVVRRKKNTLEEEYAQSSGSSDDLERTAFGRALLALQKTVPVFGCVGR